MEWNVFRYDINAKQIKTFNIFDHGGFREDFKKAAKKFKDDREGFEAEVKQCLLYYFWCRSEYEVLICSWPYSSDRNNPVIKVDPTKQIEINWDAFINYVWEHRKEVKG